MSDPETRELSPDGITVVFRSGEATRVAVVFEATELTVTTFSERGFETWYRGSERALLKSSELPGHTLETRRDTLQRYLAEKETEAHIDRTNTVRDSDSVSDVIAVGALRGAAAVTRWVEGIVENWRNPQRNDRDALDREPPDRDQPNRDR